MFEKNVNIKTLPHLKKAISSIDNAFSETKLHFTNFMLTCKFVKNNFRRNSAKVGREVPSALSMCVMDTITELTRTCVKLFHCYGLRKYSLNVKFSFSQNFKIL